MSLRIAIIGAGLAGTAVAACLSQRDDARVDTLIIDEGAQSATGASGNPAGVVLPHIAIESNPTTRFSKLGFEYLQKKLKHREQSSPGGLLCVARDSQELRRMERVLSASSESPFGARLVDSRQATLLAGVQVEGSGLYYPDHFWVSPHEICLRNVHSSELLLKTRVASISQDDNGQWCLWDLQGCRILQADMVVIAAAHECKLFEQTAWIPLFKVRGQIQRIKPTLRTANLRAAISYGGYVTPASPALPYHIAGSTFDWKNLNPSPRQSDLDSIMSDLGKVAPDFQEAATDLSQSRVSFRATSPDTLPMIGRVADPRRSRPGDIQYYEGLYASVGHGSRGLLYTQISGEILASMMLGYALPIDGALAKHIAPERFLIRKWRAG